MNKVLIGIAVAVAIVLLVVVSLVGRGCNTASEMADKTVFNADKHVWSYEQFKHQYEAFQQHVDLYASAKVNMKELTDANVPRDDAEFRNLIMQKTGAMQMARNIAKEYNAMSQIAYQKIWKGDNLPETLELPAGM
jgi:hypothetical protein